MSRIIDQYSGDPTHAMLYVLLKDKPQAKELLKTASFDVEKVESLPDSAFAWPDTRKYPIHTREDTVASLLYRTKEASVPEDVDERLVTAAKVYGITAGMLRSPMTKEAEAVEIPYALPEYKRLPLSNAAEIKMAEVVLCRDFSRLPLLKRADAFTRVVESAKKHNVELSPFTLKMAGLTTSDTAVLRTWLDARAAASSGAISEAFDKLSEELKKAPSVLQNRKELIKLASTISILDERAGLDRHYDQKLPDPLLTVFNTEKRAEEVIDLGGTTVPVSQLMQLDPQIWELVGVPELAEIAQSGDAVQFKQIMDTLPLDIKTTLAGSIGNA